MNNGYAVCKTLLALKLHFTSKSYDFFKYNGDVSLSPTGYQMRKDKYFCEKLAHKHQNVEKFVDFASTVYAHAEYPKKIWTAEFQTKASQETYEQSVAWSDSLQYRFSQELTNVMQQGIDAGFGMDWALNDDDVPPLVGMLFRKEITLEFCCVLDHHIGLIERWKKHNDDVFYDQFSTRVTRYRPFIVKRAYLELENLTECMQRVVTKFK